MCRWKLAPAMILSMFALIPAISVAAEDESLKLIHVLQTGGFAGVKIDYRITPDGKFKRKSRQGVVEGQLETKDAKALRKAIAAIDWSKMPKELRKPNVADDFLYDMQFTIGKTTHRVIADGISAGDHAQLKPILAALIKIQRAPLKE